MSRAQSGPLPHHWKEFPAMRHGVRRRVCVSHSPRGSGTNGRPRRRQLPDEMQELMVEVEATMCELEAEEEEDPLAFFLAWMREEAVDTDAGMGLQCDLDSEGAGRVDSPSRDDPADILKREDRLNRAGDPAPWVPSRAHKTNEIRALDEVIAFAYKASIENPQMDRTMTGTGIVQRTSGTCDLDQGRGALSVHLTLRAATKLGQLAGTPNMVAKLLGCRLVWNRTSARERGVHSRGGVEWLAPDVGAVEILSAVRVRVQHFQSSGQRCNLERHVRERSEFSRRRSRFRWRPAPNRLARQKKRGVSALDQVPAAFLGLWHVGQLAPFAAPWATQFRDDIISLHAFDEGAELVEAWRFYLRVFFATTADWFADVDLAVVRARCRSRCSPPEGSSRQDAPTKRCADTRGTLPVPLLDQTRSALPLCHGQRQDGPRGACDGVGRNAPAETPRHSCDP